MKKVIVALFFIASTSVSAFASNNNINPNDPCAVTLCMYGKLTGTADGKCNSAIKKYFSVKVFKHGVFRPDKTFTKRLGLLNSCPGADPREVTKIMAKFGRKFSF